jgi:hypothetical protein
MSGTLDEFVAAGPLPGRAVVRAILAIGRRPRGAALLSRFPQASQLSTSLVEMERYEQLAVSVSLGFDPPEVVRRGRELRRAEGRP